MDWRCDQSTTNWRLCDVSCEAPTHLSSAKKLIFPQENVQAYIQPKYNHCRYICMLVCNPNMKRIFFSPSSITKKMKSYEIFWTEQIWKRLAKYVTMLPICVSLLIILHISHFFLLNISQTFNNLFLSFFWF